MFAAFALMRQVHELLWYLDEARERAPDTELDEVVATLLVDDFAAADLDPTRERVGELLRRASERVRAAIPLSHAPVAAIDERPSASDSPRAVRDGVADRPRHSVRPAARRATDSATDGGRPRRPSEVRPVRDQSRADLVGMRWRGVDLRGVTLRGALLLGADLRDADLRLADLLGADLRGADLSGADLSSSLFVTPMQVAAARGDATTRLPERVPRPPHWAA
jgi:hypothetical protein